MGASELIPRGILLFAPKQLVDSSPAMLLDEDSEPADTRTLSGLLVRHCSVFADRCLVDPEPARYLAVVVDAVEVDQVEYHGLAWGHLGLGFDQAEFFDAEGCVRSVVHSVTLGPDDWRGHIEGILDANATGQTSLPGVYCGRVSG